MQKNIIICFVLFALLFNVEQLGAQASIKEDGTPIDSSAQLELQSQDKGLLLPRMTNLERFNISDPVKGLLIYQTDSNNGFRYNVNNTGFGEWETMAKSRDINLTEPRIPIDYAVTITEPGSYYLRDTLVVSNNAGRGIEIRSDNVTIDLNGFAIISENQNTDAGVRFVGSYNNITVKNGTIRGFGSNGIYGLSTGRSTFINLRLESNEDWGMYTGDNCVIINCVASQNGNDGISTGESCIIRDCVASNNGSDGIQCFQGGVIYNCISTYNGSDGISVGSGSRVENCTTNNNEVYGIDMSSTGVCMNNVAFKNGACGLDISGNSLIMNNVSNENGTCITNGTCSSGGGIGSNTNQGGGIRTFSNSVIIDNQCNGNYFGIVISGSDASIMRNDVKNNSHAGILGTSSGSIFIQNSAHGNGFAQAPGVSNLTTYPMGDIVFDAIDINNLTFGPIINVSNAGDISTIANSDHPFANFVY